MISRRVGDVLATGFWAARISEIIEEDTVLIIGAGPTGVCTLLCAMLKHPKRIIVCEKSPERIRFVRKHYPDVLVTEPENCKDFVIQNSDHGGADVVLEVAGSSEALFAAVFSGVYVLLLALTVVAGFFPAFNTSSPPVIISL